MQTTESLLTKRSPEYHTGWTDAVDAIISAIQAWQAESKKRQKQPCVAREQNKCCKQQPCREKKTVKPKSVKPKSGKTKAAGVKTRRSRRATMTFPLLKIPEGSTLTLNGYKDTVTTTGKTDVVFRGKTMPLIKATRLLLEKRGYYVGSICPANYWQYNGVTLRKLYKEKVG